MRGSGRRPAPTLATVLTTGLDWLPTRARIRDCSAQDAFIDRRSPKPHGSPGSLWGYRSVRSSGPSDGGSGMQERWRAGPRPLSGRQVSRRGFTSPRLLTGVVPGGLRCLRWKYATVRYLSMLLWSCVRNRPLPFLRLGAPSPRPVELPHPHNMSVVNYIFPSDMPSVMELINHMPLYQSVRPELSGMGVSFRTLCWCSRRSNRVSVA